jgi:hypothetical protein
VIRGKKGKRFRCEGCGKEFSREQGVRVHISQWCRIRRRVSREIHQYKKEEKEELVGLMYADDLVILSEDEDKCKKAMRVVEKWSLKWQLEVHVNKEVKTKSAVMVAGEDGEDRWKGKWKMYGKELAVVKEYPYLGLINESSGGWEKMVRDRKLKCENRIGEIARRCEVLGLNRLTTWYVLKTLVVNKLCYGSEVAVLNIRQRKAWESVVNRMIRRVLGIGAKVDVNLAKRLLSSDECKLWTEIQGRRLKLGARVKDMDKKYWARKCWEGLGRYVKSSRRRNWKSCLDEALEEYNLDMEEYNRMSLEEVSKFVKRRKKEICACEIEQVMSRKRRSLRGVKSKESNEWWLRGARDDSWWIIRSRVNNLGLREEVGRWDGNGLGCKLCGAKVEDSWHVITECKKYEELRSKMMTKIGSKSVKAFGKYILCNYKWKRNDRVKQVRVVKESAEFIKSVLIHRKRLLEEQEPSIDIIKSTTPNFPPVNRSL